jgi:hypothetical protein
MHLKAALQFTTLNNNDAWKPYFAPTTETQLPDPRSQNYAASSNGP